MQKKIDRSGLTEQEIEELHIAFDLFDTENKGTIDPQVSLSSRNCRRQCGTWASTRRTPLYLT
jgi:hypothetical protein